MEGDEGWAGLGELVFEYFKVGFYIVVTSIVYFRSLILHGDQAIIYFPNLLDLILIANLKSHLLEHLPQPNNRRTVIPLENLPKALPLRQIRQLKVLGRPLDQRLLHLRIAHNKLLHLRPHRLPQLFDDICNSPERLVQFHLELRLLGVDHVGVHFTALLAIHEVVVDVGLAGEA